jgi:ERCC4-type nuclease
MNTPGPRSPVVVIDSREQCPLSFANLPSRVGTLYSGDYSVAGCEELFAVERKSVADAIQSLTGERERFAREMHRLRGFRFARLLIVGTEADISAHRYVSNANPRAVLHSLWAFETRYNVAVVFSPDPDRAALLVERWAFWFHREQLKIADGIQSATTPIEQPAS